MGPPAGGWLRAAGVGFAAEFHPGFVSGWRAASSGCGAWAPSRGACGLGGSWPRARIRLGGPWRLCGPVPRRRFVRLAFGASRVGRGRRLFGAVSWPDGLCGCFPPHVIRPVPGELGGWRPPIILFGHQTFCFGLAAHPFLAKMEKMFDGASRCMVFLGY